MTDRHIVAFGGGGFSDVDRSPIDGFILDLTRKERPKVCFLATATGDDTRYVVRFYERLTRRAETSHLSLFATPLPDVRERLRRQDVVYVGGGSTTSMLGVWRAHGVDLVLRELWEQGTVLCGVSAGGVLVRRGRHRFGRPGARSLDRRTRPAGRQLLSAPGLRTRAPSGVPPARRRRCASGRLRARRRGRLALRRIGAGGDGERAIGILGVPRRALDGCLVEIPIPPRPLDGAGDPDRSGSG